MWHTQSSLLNSTVKYTELKRKNGFFVSQRVGVYSNTRNTITVFRYKPCQNHLKRNFNRGIYGCKHLLSFLAQAILKGYFSGWADAHILTTKGPSLPRGPTLPKGAFTAMWPSLPRGPLKQSSSLPRGPSLPWCPLQRMIPHCQGAPRCLGALSSE